MLILGRKADLLLAIQADLKTALDETRYLPTTDPKGGEGQMNTRALTDEDIQRNLDAIKAGLVEASGGGDLKEEEVEEVEKEEKKYDVTSYGAIEETKI